MALEFRNRVHGEDPAYLAQSTEQALHKQKFVAFIIGILAIGLAVGVNVLDIAYDPRCARSSISHYFYEPVAGTFFVMALAFVAAFLFAYRGENRWDGRIATVAGVAALMVAFFPTDGVGCDGEAVDLRPRMVLQVQEDEIKPDLVEAGMEYVELRDRSSAVAGASTARYHWIGAATLFAILFYFSACVFTRVRPGIDETGGKLVPAKRMRNRIYLATSTGMGIGFVLILFDGTFAWIGRPVFVGEALGLASFGIAWMVKGRFLLGWLDSPMPAA